MAENLENQNQQAAQSSEEELSEVLRVRREKLAALQEAGNDPFQQTRYERTHYAKEIADRFEELEEQSVSIAGRIMSKRSMGKASFFDVADASGRIQVYIKKDIVGEETYNQFKKWDIGDIVGVKGEVFRTKHGEISIRATEAILLSKSLLPLPEKFHGLTNTDLRYRQRYVDLIVNPEVRDVFVKRSQIIRELRSFLDSKGYLEVETPVLHNVAGGAAARPFITHHNTLNMDMYLRIALELHLKRLIVGGFDKVYEIGRVFRNEGMDTKHNPEFTMLEFYQAYANFEDIMNLTEELLRYVTLKVLGTTTVLYGDTEIDLGKPFERISMVEAVKKYTGIDFDQINTLEEARAVAKEHHIEYEQRHLKGDILNLFFDEFVEDKLIQPTFLTGHPVEISPLSKKDASHPGYTERFELFITAQGTGRRGSHRHGQRLHHRTGIRPAANRRFRYGRRPSGHVPDQPALHPRRPALPDHEESRRLQLQKGRKSCRTGACLRTGKGGGKDRLLQSPDRASLPGFCRLRHLLQVRLPRGQGQGLRRGSKVQKAAAVHPGRRLRHRPHHPQRHPQLL